MHALHVSHDWLHLQSMGYDKKKKTIPASILQLHKQWGTDDETTCFKQSEVKWKSLVHQTCVSQFLNLLDLNLGCRKFCKGLKPSPNIRLRLNWSWFCILLVQHYWILNQLDNKAFPKSATFK